ncbi:MAG: type II secretion system protein M, partial [Campylobacterales bacterium]
MKALQERLTALLDALDGYFELKETREKWLLILMPLLVSAFASYQFLVPSVTKQRTNDRQMIDELRLHIAEKESKLEVYRSLLQSKASSLETQRLMQTLAQA